MIIEGNFKYFFNNEEKTREEIEKLANYATNITVGNGCVNYFSAKKVKKESVLALDDLKYFMINLDSTEKDLTDIIHLITAENKEDLGVCPLNVDRLIPETTLVETEANIESSIINSEVKIDITIDDYKETHLITVPFMHGVLNKKNENR